MAYDLAEPISPLDLTWIHLVSLGCSWFHLDAVGLTWPDLLKPQHLPANWRAGGTTPTGGC